MRLRYFQSNNFGDALNPFIFKHLLPNFFDENDDIEFCGIGSTLGLDILKKESQKIIFSSGFAYGGKPVLDATYQVYCVRGPLTAKILHLPSSKAVADGALLLRFIESIPKPKHSKFDYSYMPHWESSLKFNWKMICEETGIHYIDPLQDYHQSLLDIAHSKIVIAEAMHAAIVADTLRVPWIPVKSYNGINEFKWRDWCESLNLLYAPNTVPSLYDNTPFVRNLCSKKISTIPSERTYASLIKFYQTLQKHMVIPKTINEFEKLKSKTTFLSEDKIFDLKSNHLMELLLKIKEENKIL